MLSNPIELLAKHPVLYTGTEWKYNNLSNFWTKILQEKRWVEDVEPLLAAKAISISQGAEQLALPAYEPNELIEQANLARSKGGNQAISLVAVLSGVLKIGDGEQRIIPHWIEDKYGKEKRVELAYLSTDVGKRVRQRNGWKPRRNLLLSESEMHSSNHDNLAEKVLSYWTYLQRESEFDEGEVTHAVDAALAMVQCVLSGEIVESRVTVGNSVAGVYFGENLLATDKRRKQVLEYLVEKYRGDRKIIDRGYSPLAILHNRAGGMMLEDLHDVGGELGIAVEMLSSGDGEVEKMQDLLHHLEGVPYNLFLTLLLSVATSNCERSLFREDRLQVQKFPREQKDRLRVS